MSKQGEALNKSNILSFDSLKEKHEKEFTLTEAYVSLQDEMVSYKYYEKFPINLQDEFMKDFIEFAIKTVEDPEYGELLGAMGTYMTVLIIDKFTDIEIPEDDKQKIIYANYLADFDILGAIINNFDENEISSLLEKATEISKQRTEELQELVGMYNEQAENIENLSALRSVEKDLGEQEKDGE